MSSIGGKRRGCGRGTVNVTLSIPLELVETYNNEAKNGNASRLFQNTLLDIKAKRTGKQVLDLDLGQILFDKSGEVNTISLGELSDERIIKLANTVNKINENRKDMQKFEPVEMNESSKENLRGVVGGMVTMNPLMHKLPDEDEVRNISVNERARRIIDE